MMPLSLLALKLVSREELSPRERGRAPGTKLGMWSLRVPLKNQILACLILRGSRETTQLMVIFVARKQVKCWACLQTNVLCEGATSNPHSSDAGLHFMCPFNISQARYTYCILGAQSENSILKEKGKWGAAYFCYFLCFLQRYFFKRNPFNVKRTTLYFYPKAVRW